MKAVAEVNAGAKQRATAAKYDIPWSTFCDKLKGRTPLHRVNQRGPEPYLTPAQEKRLLDYLIWRSKIGYGIPAKEVAEIVQEVLNESEANGYHIPDERKFKDNKPSSQWIFNFIHRHPEISNRSPENMGFARTKVTEEIIRGWFEELRSFLEREHGIDAKEFCTEINGARIYNMDEKGFALQGSSGKLNKIVAERGSKNVHTVNTD